MNILDKIQNKLFEKNQRIWEDGKLVQNSIPSNLWVIYFGTLLEMLLKGREFVSLYQKLLIVQANDK